MRGIESTRTPVAVGALVEQLRALGVEAGQTPLVHTSFRAVGPVEGGPGGLIEALDRAVGPTGTLVMPSWSDARGLFDSAQGGPRGLSGHPVRSTV